MWFGGVDQQTADVGFFDGCEGAEGGEFFDADFAFAGFTESGGIEDLQGFAFEFDVYAVDVASSSLFAADDGLLFGTESVEKTGFADVGSAN